MRCIVVERFSWIHSFGMYKKRLPVPSFPRRDTQRYILIRYYSIILTSREVAEVKGFLAIFGESFYPLWGSLFTPLDPFSGESFYPLWGSLFTPLSELSTALRKTIPGRIVSSIRRTYTAASRPLLYRGHLSVLVSPRGNSANKRYAFFAYCISSHPTVYAEFI